MTTDASLAAIAALDDRIARLEQLLQASQLGLGDPPVSRIIHCNRGHGGLWYFWDGGNKVAIPVTAKSITGFIRSLDVEAGEYKGETTHSMRLALDCGQQNYVLSAGHKSLFARCIYLALGAMTAEQLRGPIAIAPKAGTDDEKALLASVWAGTTFIKSDWTDDPTKIRESFMKALKTIQEVNSHA